jgi:hypothetical protein
LSPPPLSEEQAANANANTTPPDMMMRARLDVDALRLDDD